MANNTFSLMQGVLHPAYGRDYKNKADVIAAFRAGKDFRINFYTGYSTYCSIRDAKVGEMVKLRYNKLESALFYTVTQADK